MTRSRLVLRLGMTALIASGLCAAWGGAEEASVTRRGCYISTGDNDWLWDSPPTQSPADVKALFTALHGVFGCDRVYWRGFQSELIVDHFQVRPENFTG